MSQISQGWGFTGVIPATWEVEIGGSQSEVGPGKSTRPNMKKQSKTKELGVWLMW
jgi:hypothetical protein